MKPLSFWQYVRKMLAYAPGVSTLHAGLWLAMDLLGLIPAIVVSRLFDRLVSNASSPGYLPLIGALAAVALGQGILWLAAGTTEVRMRFRMSNFIRRNLLHAILSRIRRRQDPEINVGDTLSRIRQDAYYAADMLDWTDEIIMQGAVQLVVTVVLFVIDWRMAVISLVPMLGVVALVQLARNRLATYRERSSQATGVISGAIGDMLAAVSTIQVSSAEAQVIGRLRFLNRERRSAALVDSIATQTLDCVSTNLAGLGYGVVMLLAAIRIQSNALSVGDFVLFATLFATDVAFFAGLSSYLAQRGQAMVAFERMSALLKGAPAEDLVRRTDLTLGRALPSYRAPDDNARVQLECFEAHGLSVKFGPDRPTLDGVSLSVPRGSLTVVTGPVGDGKSTLLRVLAGLEPVTSGWLTWNGRRIDDPATFLRPPNVGYTAQDPKLFSDTAEANISLGSLLSPETLDAALHSAVVADDVETWPERLDTQIGSRGIRLSGGQRQRLATARMVARCPELLVVDDVSSALDVETERTLWDRLLEDPEATCIAVSHRRPTLLRADQIIVLKDGRVEDTGTLEELLERNEFVQHVWRETGEFAALA